MKPFRPPLLKQRPPPTSSGDDNDTLPIPAAKRQRINTSGSSGSDDPLAGRIYPSSFGSGRRSISASSLNGGRQPEKKEVPKEKSFSSFMPIQKKSSRQPLLSLAAKAQNPTPTIAPAGHEVSHEGYYNVLWRKKTTKKHKTFDGDGVLTILNGYATLQDTSGRDLGKTLMNKSLEIGDVISIGGKDVEIDSLLSKADFLAGRPFLTSAPPAEPAPLTVDSFYGKKTGFKTPLLNNTVVQKRDKKVPTARHDVTAKNALIMKRWDGKVPAGKHVVDVIVDPYLTQHLRPHQREGIAFMYECVMGLKPYEGYGAILADEMGLGKTLQTIALIWTLLKQNPIYEDGPVVKKAMIVCPVTLINNWRKEFKKWLGNERVGVFVADSKANLRDFIAGKTYHVCIIGYEKLQSVHTDLKKANIDIIIADEGHRLKTEKNKSAQAIRALNAKRRIILSGTPLQNDLHEYFIVVDFVNPGLLQTYQTFRKEFENPILKSRQPDASPKEVEIGKARSQELARITAMFVLRRTSEILSKYLPPKKEYIIYCRPTTRQLQVYRAILDSRYFEDALGNSSSSLNLITMLKKLCNSPGLLSKDDGELNATTQKLLSAVEPKHLASQSPSVSGKLRVLARLVETLKATTNEKIVIVSNYTSTLDMIQTMLSARGLTFLRLDGKTPADKRQQLVDEFNRTSEDRSFAFLLSAKSGGAGLNLIGASRLVLYDLDWNPATDAQAMARIHRDGQPKPVFIYRLLTTGCFDEKIFQRQITKQGLADEVMDKKSGAAAFSIQELRDLFTLVEDTKCGTHDLMGCTCGGRGFPADSLSASTSPKATHLLTSDLESSPEPDPWSRGLVPASQVTEDIIRGPDRRKDKVKGKKDQEVLMGNLMLYDHVDVELLRKEVEKSEEGEPETVGIEDEVLMKVLVEREKAREVTMVFQRSFGVCEKGGDSGEGEK